MSRPVLATFATVVAAVAIVVVMMMGDAGTPAHHHQVAVAGQRPAAAPEGVPADPAGSGSAGSGQPATMLQIPAATATASPGTSPGATAVAAPGTAPAALSPAGDPASHRQISLGEAAASGVPTVPARPESATGWIDAEAAGVNDGTKKQAADVPLQRPPSVAPENVLPSNGQVSGCVTGYGRGAVCLPQTPPSHAGHGQTGGQDLSRYWTCAELRELLPEGVVVDGPNADILGLDTNLDGTACAAGDR